MPNIQINIKDKVARGDGTIIICDNSDYTAVFDFDDEWSAYETKTARFVYGGRYTDVVFSGNECPVPVMQDTRAVTVGVFAGDLHTTTPAYFACVPSILCGNGIPADPTPDVYAQIMELLGKISDESVAKAVTDALEQAKVSGEFDGEKGNDGVSPAVSVAAITGGNRVTITDAEGAKTFDVMDGAQGVSGADGKDYVLTDADKQEIAKTAAGLVDVPSVQSDWNQNDETAADYVKNRPFYTGNPVETVLVEESTVPFEYADGMYMVQFPSTFAATVGETYKVNWDGTAYECVCADFSGMTIIGNLSIAGAGSDTGEPFVMDVSNGIKINIFTADTSASHTFSISGRQTQIVKIPAKFIDKDASGYIVIHKNSTMTKQEAQNYGSSISAGEVVFIIWGDLCINGISFGSSTTTGDFMSLQTQNDGIYKISLNDGGLYEYKNRVFSFMSLPKHRASDDNIIFTFNYANRIEISPAKINAGVGSTDALFIVQPNGTKSKAFNVLGNGEAVAPALILYSSTANSTKKFRITVDDSGTITATEVS